MHSAAYNCGHMQTRHKTKTAKRLTVNLSTLEKNRAKRAARADGRTLSNWALNVINRAVEASERAAVSTEGGAS